MQCVSQSLCLLQLRTNVVEFLTKQNSSYGLKAMHLGWLFGEVFLFACLDRLSGRFKKSNWIVKADDEVVTVVGDSQFTLRIAFIYIRLPRASGWP